MPADQLTFSDFCTGSVADFFSDGTEIAPPVFRLSIFEWIVQQEGRGSTIYPLSYVELTFALASESHFGFPFFVPILVARTSLPSAPDLRGPLYHVFSSRLEMLFVG